MRIPVKLALDENGVRRHVLSEAIIPRRGQARGKSVDARSLRARQDPHSLFLVFAGLLLTCTLVADLVMHREDLDVWVLALLMFAAAALSIVALVRGRRFPRWFGLTCVGLLTLASLYFMSAFGDEQSAVSSLQELPILALYLGWFVRPPLNRVLMYASLAMIAVVMVSNPIFHVDGSLGVATAIQAVVAMVFCFEVGAALWRRTEHEVTSDALTRALNRAGFMAQVDEGLTRSLRTGTPLSLVVVDFDHFKQLNDSHGHAAGDRALVDTVQHWRDGLRARDFVGRTGGDEFAILLDRTDAHSAQQTMRRLRTSSPHPWSWGISQARDGDDVESLFDRADSMLYSFKRGRT